MTTSAHIARVKKVELLSSFGAGILGGGIALLLANLLTPYAIPILFLGLMSHAVGMSQKHSLEQHSEAIRVWWAEVLYWLCWLALAALLVWIVIRQS
jgi:hypothetical protein